MTFSEEKNYWTKIDEGTVLKEIELNMLGNEKPGEGTAEVSDLPVAYKQLTGDIDPNKKTIVISYTEAQAASFGLFCRYLDRYIQSLPSNIKDKYNILVAVSTSAEDMLRALKKVKENIGNEWSKAKFLFLNDMGINRRTANGVNDSQKGGENIIEIAKRFIGDSALIRTLIQSGGRIDTTKYNETNSEVNSWETSTDKAVSEIANLFQENKIPWINSKLGSAEVNKNGIAVPLEAFIEFLHRQEESSGN